MARRAAIKAVALQLNIVSMLTLVWMRFSNHELKCRTQPSPLIGLQTRAQAQLAVGAMGLPILCEVVREERDDLEMLRGALECLCLAVPASSAGDPRRPQVDLLPCLSCGRALGRPHTATKHDGSVCSWRHVLVSSSCQLG